MCGTHCNSFLCCTLKDKGQNYELNCLRQREHKTISLKLKTIFTQTERKSSAKGLFAHTSRSERDGITRAK